ncbi:hypothetical protein RJ639_022117 [Escallonia herrerae]|uniref:Uncharacterized protein n=1 Tax=Escallonia herrerae TaxID=1293975 RepID=A0AA88V3Y6_9ASTE|nr:hypothetical protein RJ639_022117 [Escallonia herrerae]
MELCLRSGGYGEILEKGFVAKDKPIDEEKQQQFELMEQGKEENICDYFSRREKLVNEMKNNGDGITEKDVLEKIMRTLSSRFDYMVTAIEESKVMTLNDLQASLESREMWMNKRSQSSMEKMLKAQINLRNEKENTTSQTEQNQRGLNFRGRGGKNFRITARQGAGGAVSWSSNKQPLVALSTTEAELKMEFEQNDMHKIRLSKDLLTSTKVPSVPAITSESDNPNGIEYRKQKTKQASSYRRPSITEFNNTSSNQAALSNIEQRKIFRIQENQ